MGCCVSKLPVYYIKLRGKPKAGHNETIYLSNALIGPFIARYNVKQLFDTSLYYPITREIG